MTKAFYSIGGGGYPCPFSPFFLGLFLLFFVKDSVLGTKWTKWTKWGDKMDKRDKRDKNFGEMRQKIRQAQM